MTPDHKTALEGLVGRSLTSEEISALDPLIQIRNDVEVANVLSVGRTRYTSTRIGPGTIIAILGEAGGTFLDDLTTLGETDRTVFWAMNPITRGEFDIGIKEARDSMRSLKIKLPQHSENIDKILSTGLTSDPIAYGRVSTVLNNATPGVMNYER